MSPSGGNILNFPEYPDDEMLSALAERLDDFSPDAFLSPSFAVRENSIPQALQLVNFQR
jgi:hypothetical protein